jgi:hypothetical protein
MNIDEIKKERELELVIKPETPLSDEEIQKNKKMCDRFIKAHNKERYKEINRAYKRRQWNNFKLSIRKIFGCYSDDDC